MPPPQSAFYAIAKLPVDDAETFVRWLLTTSTSTARPSCWLPRNYATPDLGRDEAPLAYILNVDDIKRAMET